jgi:hypothetical protein
MPRAVELVAGFATNPGATFTVLTPSTGTSFTIRNTDPAKAVWLLSSWAFNASAGELRIRSTKLHDFQQCIRNRVTAAFTAPLFPGHTNGSFAQRLFAQDALTVEITGGAAELDCGALLILYEDLQGASGRFVDQAFLKKNGLNTVTIEVTVTAGVAGNFAGAVAVNSTNDNLIANTDYAILGGMVDTRGTAVGITGIDFSNLRLGFPAEPTLRDETQNWFEQLTLAFNTPLIPVFSSANKASTTVDVETNGAGGTYIINLECVQLMPNTVGPGLTGAAVAGAAQPGA